MEEKDGIAELENNQEEKANIINDDSANIGATIHNEQQIIEDEKGIANNDSKNDFEFLKFKNQTSGGTIDEESIEQSHRSEKGDPQSLNQMEGSKQNRGNQLK